MHRSRSVAPAALALTTLLALSLARPGRTRANESLQGSVSAAAGWTDNVLASPTREQDAVFQLKPGILFVTGSPRAVQQVGDVFSADLYARHANGNSYSNRLFWNGLYLPSQRTELSTQVESNIGKTNSINSLADSSAATNGVIPPGGNTYFDSSAREYFSYSATPLWRLTEGGMFRVFVPLVPANASPVTWNGSLSLGFERLFKRDTLGADLRADYIQYDDVINDAGMLLTPVQRQMVLSVVPRWRRDWTPFLSTDLAAGAMVAFRAEDGSGLITEPTGLVALHYIRKLMAADLFYSHTITANPFAGQSFAIDEATLHGLFPFAERTHLALSVSGSYAHARPIAVLGGPSGTSYHDVLADATLTWQPRPEVGVYLRYQFFDQFSPIPAQAFYRNRVMVGVTAIYPATVAAAVPQRPGQRVDRSDAAIPEPHSPPPVN